MARTVEEWKATIRSELRKALAAKDRHALAVLRETLAAIDNAEAPAATNAAPASAPGVFAGSESGLGAGEIARLALSPEAVTAIVDREIRERRDAEAMYVKLGRTEEAHVLASQADLLAALAGKAI